VVRRVNSGLAHDADRAFGDAGAMRQYRARPEKTQLLVVRVLDRVAVHMGPEADVVPLHQVGDRLCLPAYPAFLLRAPHGVVLVSIPDAG
jgi:hypothetical protein